MFFILGQQKVSGFSYLRASHQARACAFSIFFQYSPETSAETFWPEVLISIVGEH